MTAVSSPQMFIFVLLCAIRVVESRMMDLSPQNAHPQLVHPVGFPFPGVNHMRSGGAEGADPTASHNVRDAARHPHDSVDHGAMVSARIVRTIIEQARARVQARNQLPRTAAQARTGSADSVDSQGTVVATWLGGDDSSLSDQGSVTEEYVEAGSSDQGDGETIGLQRDDESVHEQRVGDRTEADHRRDVLAAYNIRDVIDSSDVTRSRHHSIPQLASGPDRERRGRGIELPTEMSPSFSYQRGGSSFAAVSPRNVHDPALVTSAMGTYAPSPRQRELDLILAIQQNLDLVAAARQQRAADRFNSLLGHERFRLPQRDLVVQQELAGDNRVNDVIGRLIAARAQQQQEGHAIVNAPDGLPQAVNAPESEAQRADEEAAREPEIQIAPPSDDRVPGAGIHESPVRADPAQPQVQNLVRAQSEREPDARQGRNSLLTRSVTTSRLTLRTNSKDPNLRKRPKAQPSPPPITTGMTSARVAPELPPITQGTKRDEEVYAPPDECPVCYKACRSWKETFSTECLTKLFI